MFILVVGTISSAVILGLGVFGYQKVKGNQYSTEGSQNKYKKYRKQVDELYEDITTMNPFAKEKTIFEKGQDLIYLALRVRDNSGNTWYSDNNVLQLLLDYDNLYKDLLNKYSYDPLLEQFVFEGLVRGYQAFWISLESKSTSEERIKYMKDMFVIFNEVRPKIEEELKLLIEDQEIKENIIVHNDRIQSKEVVSQVFESSLNQLRDKKRYSVAKTINETNEAMGVQGTDVETKDKVDALEKQKDKLTIDDL